MLADLPLRPTSPEVAAREVVDVGGVHGPVVALAVGRAARLDEAVVEGEVVADGVSPAGAPGPEVRVVVEDPLVDVAENQLLVLGAEDGHGDEADVGVGGFGLLLHETGPRVPFVQVLGVRVQVGRGVRAQTRRVQGLVLADAQQLPVVAELGPVELEGGELAGGGVEGEVGRRGRDFQPRVGQ